MTDKPTKARASRQFPSDNVIVLYVSPEDLRTAADAIERGDSASLITDDLTMPNGKQLTVMFRRTEVQW